jgi:hypothetical protein
MSPKTKRIKCIRMHDFTISKKELQRKWLIQKRLQWIQKKIQQANMDLLFIRKILPFKSIMEPQLKIFFRNQFNILDIYYNHLMANIEISMETQKNINKTE